MARTVQQLDAQLRAPGVDQDAIIESMTPEELDAYSEFSQGQVGIDRELTGEVGYIGDTVVRKGKAPEASVPELPQPGGNDLLNLTGAGLGRGGMNLIGMIGDALNPMSGVRLMAGQDPEQVRSVPGFGQDLIEGSKKILPFMRREPESPLETIYDRALQGAVGGIAGPGGVVRNAMIGGIGGATGGAAEAGLDAAGVEDGAFKQGAVAIADIAGALLGNRATDWKYNTKDIIQQGMKPEDLQQVIAAADAAKRLRGETGVPVNTVDMLPSQSGLRDIAAALTQMGKGDKLTTNIRNQVPAMQQYADQVVESLPGKTLPTQTVDNQLQDAATGAIAERGKAANKRFGADLDGARAAERAKLEADAVKAKADADAALEVAGQAERMAGNDRKVAAAEAKAEQTVVNRENLVKSAQEVATPPVFSADDLGMEIVGINAKRIQTGQPQKNDWTPQELLDAGYPRKKLEQIWAKKQPVTEGKGTVQGNQEAGPGEVIPFVPKAEKMAKELVADADQAYSQALDEVKGLDRIKPEGKAEVIGKIDRLIEENKANLTTVRDLQYIRRTLENKVETSGDLHVLLRSINDNLPSMKSLNNKGKQASKNAAVSPVLDRLGSLRDETTEGYRIAGDNYKLAKDEMRGVQRDTELTAFSTKGGTIPDQPGPGGVFTKLMEEGEDPKIPANASRLRTTLREIGKQDKGSLTNAFRTYLKEKLLDAFGNVSKAEPNMAAGKKLTSAFGDINNPDVSKRMQGLEIAADEVARANGMSASDAFAMKRGLSQLVEVANANSRSPVNVTTMSTRELTDMAKDMGVWETAGLLGINIGGRFLNIVRPATLEKTVKELDEVLSNPDKIDTLVKLGKRPKWSRAQRARIAAFLSAAVVSQNSEGVE